MKQKTKISVLRRMMEKLSVHRQYKEKEKSVYCAIVGKMVLT